MSSSEGLGILKNWLKTEASIILPQVSWKSGMTWFEANVRLRSVDESVLVLENMDAPGEIVSIDLGAAELTPNKSSAMKSVNIRFADGKSLFLYENKRRG